jgi:hypothetical protein
MNIQDKTKEELQKELTESQREVSYLNAIKDIDDAKRKKLEQELADALQEIAFQDEEKSKRAAELIIANLELKFQSEEKAKRAAELVIANIELVFQNKEKAKRAAELIIANKELTFQNEVKAKQAAELMIALEKVEASKIEINERVKELNGLFSLGLLTEKFENIEDIYNEFVNVIVPNSMQFPEKVFVELEVENRKYCNIKNFNLSLVNKCLVTTISLFEKPSGTLTVTYIENLPFIEFYEQKLINTYGIRISGITERIISFQKFVIEKEKAEEFERKFKQIAENIDEVFWLRTNSEMIYISPSFEKIWGIPCESIYENPQIFTEKIHPEDKPVVHEIFHSKEFKDNGLFNYEYRIISAENQVRWINAKTFPVIDETGQIIKRVGIAADATEKYQSIQELIQAKKHAEESDMLKTAFLCNMSHEIRTPMNGILGFAELLKGDDLSGEQQQKYIQIIEKSGARMLNIINDIVSISKIESGIIDIYLSETNINNQLQFVYDSLKLDADIKKINLSFNCALTEKEATIKTDSEKFYSILSNLVKNAIKYTDKGTIEFGYTNKGEEFEFYVKDTGIGIQKERQEAIFERFIQADIVDKMARQGAGLGLAISKAYTEILGGKIWVESEEGKGSIFFFTLPCNLDSKEQINIPTAILSENEAKPIISEIFDLKVLIVEDDEASEMLISIELAKFSKEILKVTTGIDAIETCLNNPDIDLVLMDIQMPGMNGYEATRKIREFNKEVIIIAQTAFALTGDREKAIESGCNNYISKPIKQTELMELIRTYFKK